MRILPKKYFKWREPKAFCALLDAEDPFLRLWWPRPLLGVVVSGSLMLNWFLLHINPAKHPPPFPIGILNAVADGVLLAYFMPWLYTKLPSEIRVFEHYLIRGRGDQSRKVRFADLTSFAWGSAVEFSTLLLTDRRGRQIFIGVPHDFATEALTAFLAERIAAQLTEGHQPSHSRLKRFKIHYSLVAGKIRAVATGETARFSLAARLW